MIFIDKIQLSIICNCGMIEEVFNFLLYDKSSFNKPFFIFFSWVLTCTKSLNINKSYNVK